jgi:hypothetical protein
MQPAVLNALADVVRNVIGMVITPRATFTRFGKRAPWLAAWIMVLATSLITTGIVFRVVATDTSFETIAKDKIVWDAEAVGLTVTPQVLAEQTEQLRNQRRHWYLFAVYAVLVSTLGLSVFFYVVLKLARANITFRSVFAVVCWSMVIYRVIGGIPTIISLLVTNSADFKPAPPEAWSPTSLARLVSRDDVSHNVYSAISKIDPFLVWWLAVLSIGFATIARNLTATRSVAIIAASEIVYLALNAVGALQGAS